MKTKFRIVLFLLALTFINNYSNAIGVEGYIINENSDTIYGTIKLHKFDQMTGGYIPNGFDINSLNYKVSFKKNGTKSYKLLLPGSIQGFGFSYKAVVYSYKSFLLNYNSILKNEEKVNRFLLLVYKGNVQMYQNNVCIILPGKYSNNNSYYTDFEFFLYDKPNGLLKIETNKQIKSLHDLLHKFNFDPRFIQEIPDNTEIKEIEEILNKYDKWLLENKPISA